MAKILILYTGGTIGMQASANGLAPAGGFAERITDQFGNTLPDWEFAEILPLIDSANMTPLDWQRILSAIRNAAHTDRYRGILVLHGTDTLAFTAAALSFQLLGLPLPVLLTGAMLPAGADNSDAWDNLHGAMCALDEGRVQGVQVYFHGALLHGARTSKVRSDGHHPFVMLARTQLAPIPGPPRLAWQTQRTDSRCAVLTLFPGIDAEQVDRVAGPGVQAIIIQAFGSGTGPTGSVDFLRALKAAHGRGILLVAITQCHEGGVAMDRYEAGALLKQAGVISGGGLTLEAALGKLHALLGAGLRQDEAEYWMQHSLCGE